MAGPAVVILYSITLFLGAALLFAVQPMAARRILPLLGGSPAVWNACVLFFQAGLLVGYAYAHLLSARLGSRAASFWVHACVLVAGALALRRSGGWDDPAGSPTLWLLGALASGVGVPFVVVATGAPLLQRWFSRTSHAGAGDPYFLYAASNAGSLAGLLAYPLVVETFLPLRAQERLWSVLYAGYAALVLACGVAMVRGGRAAARERGGTQPPAPRPAPGVWFGRRARWVVLAAVPSSLVLGTTQHITTDISPIPLLWVLPLSLYLLTYILAYSRAGPLCLRWANRLLPVAAVAIAAATLLVLREHVMAMIGLHLAGLFLAAMVCHGRLAADRPDPSRLTGYYLLIGVGGALGGAFNVFAAPALFDTTVEHAGALVLACLLRPVGAPAGGRRRGDILRGRWPGDLLSRWIVDLACLLVVLAAVTASRLLGEVLVNGAPLPAPAVVAPPLLACILFAGRARVFALGLALLLASAGLSGGGASTILHRERTFFGQLTVVRTWRPAPEGPAREFVMLFHGTTIHGLQAADRRRDPTGYYHDRSPIGEVFSALAADPRGDRVGVVGLGTGVLAAYAGRPEQEMVFFEIDPAVARIAWDPRWFTFLADSPAQVTVVLGDGRLSLARPGEPFGLIVLDAFSSDSIPAHLLTLEAFGTYRARLVPGGLIAVHVSNRHLDLEPVAAAAARDLGLAALIRRDSGLSDAEGDAGRFESAWVVFAERPADFAGLDASRAWTPPAAPASFRAWTDDRSNILGVFRPLRRMLGYSAP